MFSINSMTKVFTALALAESVVAGRVGLNDTVQSHTKHAMPRDGDDLFWLLDLATHWSGLRPRHSLERAACAA
jgi:CubicO group peptidase (beta-lactamase class C family)